MINGKPSPLNAVELLSQLSSSSIERIEILTSPSVKYRSNGISGIINVITKRENDAGLNLKALATRGTRRYSLGATANYGTAHVNYRLNASWSKRAETNEQSIKRQFESGFSDSIFTPYQFIGRVMKVGAGIDVFHNDIHELSFGVDYTNDGPFLS